MAIFYCTTKVFSRAAGKSAVAAAAYRAGATLTDERMGLVHRYSGRSGVLAVETRAPAEAPGWAFELGALWNAAEAAETRKNSCVARELLVALPAELNDNQRLSLARDITQLIVDRYRVAATLAVHRPDRGGDDRNHHVHVLYTTRELSAEGLGRKTRVLDDRTTGPAEIDALRAAIAARINVSLSRAGVAETVDHRTLAAQAAQAAERGDTAAVIRLSRVPQRHEGKSVHASRRRGTLVGVARDNNDVVAINRALEAFGLNRAADLARSLKHGSVPAPSVRTPLATRTRFRSPYNYSGKESPHARPHPSSTPTDAEIAAMMIRNLRHAEREAALLSDAYVRIATTRRAHDAKALRIRLVGDADCAEALQRVIALRQEYRQLCNRHRANWKRYGRRMVIATQAKRRLEAADEQPAPPLWRPKTRREWAEHRRRLRQEADRSAAAEQQAAAAVLQPWAEERERRAVRKRWWAAESARRKDFPFLREWAGRANLDGPDPLTDANAFKSSQRDAESRGRVGMAGAAGPPPAPKPRPRMR